MKKHEVNAAATQDGYTGKVRNWLVTGVCALGMIFGAGKTVAQSSAGSGQPDGSTQPAHWYSPANYKKLNPVNLFHKDKDSRTASEELAANKDEDRKLTELLHSYLPPKTDVKDACTAFKGVEDCVATIHASHNVGVKFECLKWNVTAVKPAAGTKSCVEPDNDRPTTLERAIRALKPDKDAKYEAKNALRKARENITDARS